MRTELKDIFVRDLSPNQNQVITAFFLVHHKELRFKKTGEPYLSLQLRDRTGEVDAKMWEDVEQAPEFSPDDFIKVRARVEVFRNRPQLTIQKLRRLREEEVDLDDFFPRSARDPEEMFRELGALVASLDDAHLKALLEAILADPEIAARFKRAPAAKSLHHACLGGLLEHVLSLSRLCRLVAENYPQIRRDLLLAGAILHDLGKIYELNYDRAFRYTTRGHLLGHMIIGLEVVQEKIRGLKDFPAELKALIEHLMISHHGQYEFGSPKLPMFPEALMLHYLDDLDSKMDSMRHSLEREPSATGEWTSRCASLDRMLLRVEKYLGSSSPEEAGDRTGSEQAQAQAAGGDSPKEDL